MKTPEFTVYRHHIAFLKDFLELQSWLDLNGFSLLHSHNDFRTRLIHTFWDDHSAEAEKTGINDAAHTLTITYCLICKKVEVYHREIIANVKNEKRLVPELNQRVFGNRSDETEESESREEQQFEYPSPEDIRNWIDDLERQ
jgi:hypothetical protein